MFIPKAKIWYRIREYIYTPSADTDYVICMSEEEKDKLKQAPAVFSTQEPTFPDYVIKAESFRFSDLCLQAKMVGIKTHTEEPILVHNNVNASVETRLHAALSARSRKEDMTSAYRYALTKSPGLEASINTSRRIAACFNHEAATYVVLGSVKILEFTQLPKEETMDGMEQPKDLYFFELLKRMNFTAQTPKEALFFHGEPHKDFMVIYVTDDSEREHIVHRCPMQLQSFKDKAPVLYQQKVLATLETGTLVFEADMQTYIELCSNVDRSVLHVTIKKDSNVLTIYKLSTNKPNVVKAKMKFQEDLTIGFREVFAYSGLAKDLLRQQQKEEATYQREVDKLERKEAREREAKERKAKKTGESIVIDEEGNNIEETLLESNITPPVPPMVTLHLGDNCMVLSIGNVKTLFAGTA